MTTLLFLLLYSFHFNLYIYFIWIALVSLKKVKMLVTDKPKLNVTSGKLLSQTNIVYLLSLTISGMIHYILSKAFFFLTKITGTIYSISWKGSWNNMLYIVQFIQILTIIWFCGGWFMS